MTVELVNAETGEVVDSLTEPEARRLTERIRVALDRVSTAWADLAERITEAYQRRADLALGYRSWAEYAEAELKPSGAIAAEVRRELVAMLSAQGMGSRSIAPVVGITDRGVRKAIAAQVGTEFPPDPERINPATGEVVPAPTYKPTDVTDWTPQEIDDLIEADEREVEAWQASTIPAPKVTGLDGKTYPRPEPKTPPRRPLRDGFRDASLDLDKLVRRFESLAGDDRLPRNKNEVARYANDLTRAINALQRVADQLT